MCRPRTARPGIAAGQRHALAERRLSPAGAGAAEPPLKSLTTRCNLDQRWRLFPTTGSGFLVRKPHLTEVFGVPLLAWRHRAFEESDDGSAVPEVRPGLQGRRGPAGVGDRQADR